MQLQDHGANWYICIYIQLASTYLARDVLLVLLFACISLIVAYHGVSLCFRGRERRCHFYMILIHVCMFVCLHVCKNSNICTQCVHWFWVTWIVCVSETQREGRRRNLITSMGKWREMAQWLVNEGQLEKKWSTVQLSLLTSQFFEVLSFYCFQHVCKLGSSLVPERSILTINSDNFSIKRTTFLFICWATKLIIWCV